MTNTEINKEWEGSAFCNITKNIHLEKETLEFSHLFLLQYVIRSTNTMHMGKFCTYEFVPQVKVHMNTNHKGCMSTTYSTNINWFINPRLTNKRSFITATKKNVWFCILNPLSHSTFKCMQSKPATILHWPHELYTMCKKWHELTFSSHQYSLHKTI